MGMQSVTYAYAERQRDTKRSRCRWKRELSGRKEIVAPAGPIMCVHDHRPAPETCSISSCGSPFGTDTTSRGGGEWP